MNVHMHTYTPCSCSSLNFMNLDAESIHVHYINSCSGLLAFNSSLSTNFNYITHVVVIILGGAVQLQLNFLYLCLPSQIPGCGLRMRLLACFFNSRHSYCQIHRGLCKHALVFARLRACRCLSLVAMATTLWSVIM